MNNLNPATRKEKQALARLIELINSGMEFPEAIWAASQQGMNIDTARLRDLYDAEEAK